MDESNLLWQLHTMEIETLVQAWDVAGGLEVEWRRDEASLY
jgi:hypothetical protein